MTIARGKPPTETGEGWNEPTVFKKYYKLNRGDTVKVTAEEEVDKLDEYGQAVLDESGKTVTETKVHFVDATVTWIDPARDAIHLKCGEETFVYSRNDFLGQAK